MAITWEILITPSVTVAAVFLTNALTYGRGNREKLWELRRQVYSIIIAELNVIDHICRSADDYISENPERYFAEEVSLTHKRRISERMSVLNDRYAQDYLIVSTEFIALMDGFDDARLGGEFEEPQDVHDLFAGAVRAYIPRMVTQARREMPLRDLWSFTMNKVYMIAAQARGRSRIAAFEPNQPARSLNP